jgi:hypothetical protein
MERIQLASCGRPRMADVFEGRVVHPLMQGHLAWHT